MSALPNHGGKLRVDGDRRNRQPWGRRLEMALLIAIVCAAGFLLYVLLRTLCCGQ